MFGSSIPSIPLTAPIGNMMGGGFNGGYGYGNDNGWWVLIILFALFGGWGNRNGANNGGMPSVVYMDRGISSGSGLSGEVQRGFDTSTVISKLDGINNGICSLGYDQLAQMNGINNNIMQTGYNIQNGITQMGIAQMQDTNALSRQLGDCCCENRQGQAEIQYRMATDTCAITTSIANAARDIMDNDNANFRAISDRLTASELARKDEKIADQAQLINSLNLAVSQRNQNEYLIAQLKPCPVPAYNVPNPFNYGGQTCCGNYS